MTLILVILMQITLFHPRPSLQYFWIDYKEKKTYALADDGTLYCPAIGQWKQPQGTWNTRQWDRPRITLTEEYMKRLTEYILSKGYYGITGDTVMHYDKKEAGRVMIKKESQKVTIKSKDEP